MYGVIFDFLRNYVIDRHGGLETWRALLKASGQSPHKIYFQTGEYPDEEIVALAKSASEALSLPLADVLEDFGTFVGPSLLSFYHMYMGDPEWKTFDVIENASGRIHDVIHKHNPNRKPPLLKAKRLSDNRMIVTYRSERKMCPVVRGIIRGMGDHFGESFVINEKACMYHGAPECVFHVTRK
jgi:predicted hydrocarbon binding protein